MASDVPSAGRSPGSWLFVHLQLRDSTGLAPVSLFTSLFMVRERHLQTLFTFSIMSKRFALRPRGEFREGEFSDAISKVCGASIASLVIANLVSEKSTHQSDFSLFLTLYYNRSCEKAPWITRNFSGSSPQFLRDLLRYYALLKVFPVQHLRDLLYRRSSRRSTSATYFIEGLPGAVPP